VLARGGNCDCAGASSAHRTLGHRHGAADVVHAGPRRRGEPVLPSLQPCSVSFGTLRCAQQQGQMVNLTGSAVYDPTGRWRYPPGVMRATT